MSTPPQQPAQRLVWDLPVRIGHALLVVVVVGAYVSERIGVVAFHFHVWCGYTALVLVTFRIVWGFVGTRHARFGNFVRGPNHTVGFLWGALRGRHRLYVGHNPLGALMVIALLLALAAQAVTGLFANDEILNLGPLSGYVSNARSLALTSLHRRLFYWIAGAIAVHVLAVLAHRWVYREDLVRPMLSGRKRAASVPEAEAINNSRLGLAVALVLSLVGLLAWIIRHAPGD